MEEKNAEGKEAKEVKDVEDPKVPKKAEETTEELKDTSKKMAFIEAERIKELRDKLLEDEKRIDSKLADFRKFVDNTEIEGKSLAGRMVEKDDEEKKKDSARKLLAGTGFESVLDIER